MKRSFTLLLVLSLLSTAVWSATEIKKVSNTEVLETRDSFQKFSDRLKISYFGAYTGSSFYKWDERALDTGVRSSKYATNLFNQVSFNYNFGWKMNFVLNPRFTIYTGDTRGHDREVRDQVNIEDALVGLQGVIVSSEDKAFNWWMRPALRLPTSRLSRKSNITTQSEILNVFTYDFDKKWQLGSILQFRSWVYEEKYNLDRFRVYVAPYIQYTFTDKVKGQLYYENFAERNLTVADSKARSFKDRWQNVMAGTSIDITPKVNFFPYLGYFVSYKSWEETKLRPLEQAWLGFWFSYQIK